MGRGKLPTQTPRVPPDSFIAFDLLYRFLQQLDRDLAVVEAGGGGGGGGGGVTDHGALTGLADDDHPQYHTDARGDARYSLLGHTHGGLDTIQLLTADVTTTGSAFIDVPGLQVTLDADSTYCIEGFVLVQSNAAATSSPRIGWLFGTQVVWGTVNITADVSTAGVTVRTGNHLTNENSRTGHVANQATTSLASDRPSLVKITAMLRTTATPAAVGVTLASEVAGATVVRVLADSFLSIKKLR